MPIISSFLYYLYSLYKSARETLRGQYKWIFIMLTIWLYRIEFISGAGQWVQMLSFALACIAVVRLREGIFFVMAYKVNSAVRALSLFYLVAIVSAIWSIWPPYTFALGVQDFMIIATVVLMTKRDLTFEELERNFVQFGAILVIFLSFAARITQTSFFIHHLASGTVSAMVASYCFAEYLGCDPYDTKRMSMLRNTMLLCIIALVLSTSTGAYVSGLAGIAASLVFTRKRIYIVFAFLIVIVLMLYQELIDYFMELVFTGKDTHAIETVSGREVVWENILNLAWQRPWFGWGFGGAERALTFQGEIAAMDAHNSYIGIFGGLGFLGCGLGILCLFHIGRVLWKNLAKTGFPGLYAALVTALFNAYTFGFISGKTCSITILFFVVIIMTDAYADAHDRQYAKDHQL